MKQQTKQLNGWNFWTNSDNALLVCCCCCRDCTPPSAACNKFVSYIAIVFCVFICLPLFLCATAAADCQKRILMKRNEIKWTFGNSLRAFLCSSSSSSSASEMRRKKRVASQARKGGHQLTACVCCHPSATPFAAFRLQSANLLLVRQVSLSWRAPQAPRTDVRGVVWGGASFRQTDTPI